MKGRNISGFALFSDSWCMPIIIVLTALFLCGVIAGSMTGLIAANSSSGAIISLADSIMDKAQSIPTASQSCKAALSTFGWFTLIICLGLIRFSGLFLSICMIVRGFVLAFSVSSLFAALGLDGIYISLISGGMEVIIVVPALILCASIVIEASRQAKIPRQYIRLLSAKRRAILVCMLVSMWVSVICVPVAYILQKI